MAIMAVDVERIRMEQRQQKRGSYLYLCGIAGFVGKWDISRENALWRQIARRIQ
jgi:hypothetical protein